MQKLPRSHFPLLFHSEPGVAVPQKTMLEIWKTASILEKNCPQSGSNYDDCTAVVAIKFVRKHSM